MSFIRIEGTLILVIWFVENSTSARAVRRVEDTQDLILLLNGMFRENDV